jgi:hypothetical protein
LTSRLVFVIGFCSVLVAGVVVDLLARSGRTALATADDVLGLLQRSRLGRAATFAVWFWLGFHFLAR